MSGTETLTLSFEVYDVNGQYTGNQQQYTCDLEGWGAIFRGTFPLHSLSAGERYLAFPTISRTGRAIEEGDLNFTIHYLNVLPARQGETKSLRAEALPTDRCVNGPQQNFRADFDEQFQTDEEVGLATYWEWEPHKSGIGTTNTSFVSHPGNFLLECAAGEDTTVASSTFASPRLYIPVGFADWTVITHLTTSMITNSQVGLVIAGKNENFADPWDNWLLWGPYNDGTQLTVEGIIENSLTAPAGYSAAGFNDVWLKIQKVGTSYKFYYKSALATAWVGPVGGAAYTPGFTATQVGLMARSWPGTNFTTIFSDFSLYTEPSALINRTTLSPLIEGWTGSGIVEYLGDPAEKIVVVNDGNSGFKSDLQNYLGYNVTVDERSAPNEWTLADLQATDYTIIAAFAGTGSNDVNTLYSFLADAYSAGYKVITQGQSDGMSMPLNMIHAVAQSGGNGTDWTLQANPYSLHPVSFNIGTITNVASGPTSGMIANVHPASQVLARYTGADVEKVAAFGLANYAGGQWVHIQPVLDGSSTITNRRQLLQNIVAYLGEESLLAWKINDKGTLHSPDAPLGQRDVWEVETQVAIPAWIDADHANSAATILEATFNQSRTARIEVRPTNPGIFAVTIEIDGHPVTIPAPNRIYYDSSSSLWLNASLKHFIDGTMQFVVSSTSSKSGNAAVDTAVEYKALPDPDVNKQPGSLVHVSILAPTDTGVAMFIPNGGIIINAPEQLGNVTPSGLDSWSYSLAAYENLITTEWGVGPFSGTTQEWKIASDGLNKDPSHVTDYDTQPLSYEGAILTELTRANATYWQDFDPWTTWPDWTFNRDADPYYWWAYNWGKEGPGDDCAQANDLAGYSNHIRYTLPVQQGVETFTFSAFWSDELGASDSPTMDIYIYTDQGAGWVTTQTEHLDAADWDGTGGVLWANNTFTYIVNAPVKQIQWYITANKATTLVNFDSVLIQFYDMSCTTYESGIATSSVSEYYDSLGNNISNATNFEHAGNSFTQSYTSTGTTWSYQPLFSPGERTMNYGYYTADQGGYPGQSFRSWGRNHTLGPWPDSYQIYYDACNIDTYDIGLTTWFPYTAYYQAVDRYAGDPYGYWDYFGGRLGWNNQASGGAGGGNRHFTKAENVGGENMWDNLYNQAVIYYTFDTPLEIEKVSWSYKYNADSGNDDGDGIWVSLRVDYNNWGSSTEVWSTTRTSDNIYDWQEHSLLAYGDINRIIWEFKDIEDRDTELSFDNPFITFVPVKPTSDSRGSYNYSTGWAVVTNYDPDSVYGGDSCLIDPYGSAGSFQYTLDSPLGFPGIIDELKIDVKSSETSLIQIGMQDNEGVWVYFSDLINVPYTGNWLEVTLNPNVSRIKDIWIFCFDGSRNDYFGDITITFGDFVETSGGHGTYGYSGGGSAYWGMYDESGGSGWVATPPGGGTYTIYLDSSDDHFVYDYIEFDYWCDPWNQGDIVDIYVTLKNGAATLRTVQVVDNGTSGTDVPYNTIDTANVMQIDIGMWPWNASESEGPVMIRSIKLRGHYTEPPTDVGPINGNWVYTPNSDPVFGNDTGGWATVEDPIVGWPEAALVAPVGMTRAITLVFINPERVDDVQLYMLSDTVGARVWLQLRNSGGSSLGSWYYDIGSAWTWELAPFSNLLKRDVKTIEFTFPVPADNSAMIYLKDTYISLGGTPPTSGDTYGDFSYLPNINDWYVVDNPYQAAPNVTGWVLQTTAAGSVRFTLDNPYNGVYALDEIHFQYRAASTANMQLRVYGYGGAVILYDSGSTYYNIADTDWHDVDLYDIDVAGFAFIDIYVDTPVVLDTFQFIYQSIAPPTTQGTDGTWSSSNYAQTFGQVYDQWAGSNYVLVSNATTGRELVFTFNEDVNMEYIGFDALNRDDYPQTDAYVTVELKALGGGSLGTKSWAIYNTPGSGDNWSAKNWYKTYVPHVRSVHITFTKQDASDFDQAVWLDDIRFDYNTAALPTTDDMSHGTWSVPGFPVGDFFLVDNHLMSNLDGSVLRYDLTGIGTETIDSIEFDYVNYNSSLGAQHTIEIRDNYRRRIVEDDDGVWSTETWDWADAVDSDYIEITMDKGLGLDSFKITFQTAANPASVAGQGSWNYYDPDPGPDPIYGIVKEFDGSGYAMTTANMTNKIFFNFDNEVTVTDITFRFSWPDLSGTPTFGVSLWDDIDGTGIELSGLGLGMSTSDPGSTPTWQNYVATTHGNWVSGGFSHVKSMVIDPSGDGVDWTWYFDSIFIDYFIAPLPTTDAYGEWSYPSGLWGIKENPVALGDSSSYVLAPENGSGTICYTLDSPMTVEKITWKYLGRGVYNGWVLFNTTGGNFSINFSHGNNATEWFVSNDGRGSGYASLISPLSYMGVTKIEIYFSTQYVYIDDITISMRSPVTLPTTDTQGDWTFTTDQFDVMRDPTDPINPDAWMLVGNGASTTKEVKYSFRNTPRYLDSLYFTFLESDSYGQDTVNLYVELLDEGGNPIASAAYNLYNEGGTTGRYNDGWTSNTRWFVGYGGVKDIVFTWDFDGVNQTPVYLQDIDIASRTNVEYSDAYGKWTVDDPNAFQIVQNDEVPDGINSSSWILKGPWDSAGTLVYDLFGTQTVSNISFKYQASNFTGGVASITVRVETNDGWQTLDTRDISEPSTDHYAGWEHWRMFNWDCRLPGVDTINFELGRASIGNVRLDDISITFGPDVASTDSHGNWTYDADGQSGRFGMAEEVQITQDRHTQTFGPHLSYVWNVDHGESSDAYGTWDMYADVTQWIYQQPGGYRDLMGNSYHLGKVDNDRENDLHIDYTLNTAKAVESISFAVFFNDYGNADTAELHMYVYDDTWYGYEELTLSPSDWGYSYGTWDPISFENSYYGFGWTYWTVPIDYTVKQFKWYFTNSNENNMLIGFDNVTIQFASEFTPTSDWVIEAPLRVPNVDPPYYATYDLNSGLAYSRVVSDLSFAYRAEYGQSSGNYTYDITAHVQDSTGTDLAVQTFSESNDTTYQLDYRRVYELDCDPVFGILEGEKIFGSESGAIAEIGQEVVTGFLHRTFVLKDWTGMFLENELITDEGADQAIIKQVLLSNRLAVGDILTGDDSSATAQILADVYHGTHGTLTVQMLSGKFLDGEIIYDEHYHRMQFHGSATRLTSEGWKYKTIPVGMANVDKIVFEINAETDVQVYLDTIGISYGDPNPPLSDTYGNLSYAPATKFGVVTNHWASEVFAGQQLLATSAGPWAFTYELTDKARLEQLKFNYRVNEPTSLSVTLKDSSDIPIDTLTLNNLTNGFWNEYVWAWGEWGQADVKKIIFASATSFYLGEIDVQTIEPELPTIDDYGAWDYGGQNFEIVANVWADDVVNWTAWCLTATTTDTLTYLLTTATDLDDILFHYRVDSTGSILLTLKDDNDQVVDTTTMSNLTNYDWLVGNWQPSNGQSVKKIEFTIGAGVYLDNLHLMPGAESWSERIYDTSNGLLFGGKCSAGSLSIGALIEMNPLVSVTTGQHLFVTLQALFELAYVADVKIRLYSRDPSRTLLATFTVGNSKESSEFLTNGVGYLKNGQITTIMIPITSVGTIEQFEVTIDPLGEGFDEPVSLYCKIQSIRLEDEYLYGIPTLQWVKVGDDSGESGASGIANSAGSFESDGSSVKGYWYGTSSVDIPSYHFDYDPSDKIAAPTTKQTALTFRWRVNIDPTAVGGNWVELNPYLRLHGRDSTGAQNLAWSVALLDAHTSSAWVASAYHDAGVYLADDLNNYLNRWLVATINLQDLYRFAGGSWDHYVTDIDHIELCLDPRGFGDGIPFSVEIADLQFFEQLPLAGLQMLSGLKLDKELEVNAEGWYPLTQMIASPIYPAEAGSAWVTNSIYNSELDYPNAAKISNGTANQWNDQYQLGWQAVGASSFVFDRTTSASENASLKLAPNYPTGSRVESKQLTFPQSGTTGDYYTGNLLVGGWDQILATGGEGGIILEVGLAVRGTQQILVTPKEERGVIRKWTEYYLVFECPEGDSIRNAKMILENAGLTDIWFDYVTLEATGGDTPRSQMIAFRPEKVNNSLEGLTYARGALLDGWYQVRYWDPNYESAVTNGDFETKDLTGWTTFANPSGIVYDSATHGYVCRVSYNPQGNEYYKSWIEQDISKVPTAIFSELDFDYRIRTFTGNTLTLTVYYADGTSTISPAFGETAGSIWEHVDYALPAGKFVTKIRFESNPASLAQSGASMLLDNVRFDGVSFSPGRGITPFHDRLLASDFAWYEPTANYDQSYRQYFMTNLWVDDSGFYQVKNSAHPLAAFIQYWIDGEGYVASSVPEIWLKAGFHTFVAEVHMVSTFYATHLLDIGLEGSGANPATIRCLTPTEDLSRSVAVYYDPDYLGVNVDTRAVGDDDFNRKAQPLAQSSRWEATVGNPSLNDGKVLIEGGWAAYRYRNFDSFSYSIDVCAIEANSIAMLGAGYELSLDFDTDIIELLDGGVPLGSVSSPLALDTWYHVTFTKLVNDSVAVLAAYVNSDIVLTAIDRDDSIFATTSVGFGMPRSASGRLFFDNFNVKGINQDAELITQALAGALLTNGMAGIIVDADRLEYYLAVENMMRTTDARTLWSPFGQVVLGQDCLPNNVWNFQEDESVIEQALERGTKLVWTTGSVPFGFASAPDATFTIAAQGLFRGHQYVFDINNANIGSTAYDSGFFVEGTEDLWDATYGPPDELSGRPLTARYYANGWDMSVAEGPFVKLDYDQKFGDPFTVGYTVFEASGGTGEGIIMDVQDNGNGTGTLSIQKTSTGLFDDGALLQCRDEDGGIPFGFAFAKRPEYRWGIKTYGPIIRVNYDDEAVAFQPFSVGATVVNNANPATRAEGTVLAVDNWGNNSGSLIIQRKDVTKPFLDNNEIYCIDAIGTGQARVNGDEYSGPELWDYIVNTDTNYDVYQFSGESTAFGPGLKPGPQYVGKSNASRLDGIANPQKIFDAFSTNLPNEPHTMTWTGEIYIPQSSVLWQFSIQAEDYGRIELWDSLRQEWLLAANDTQLAATIPAGPQLTLEKGWYPIRIAFSTFYQESAVANCAVRWFFVPDGQWKAIKDDARFREGPANAPIYEGGNNHRLIDYAPWGIHGGLGSQATWLGLNSHMIFSKNEYDTMWVLGGGPHDGEIVLYDVDGSDHQARYDPQHHQPRATDYATSPYEQGLWSLPYFLDTNGVLESPGGLSDTVYDERPNENGDTARYRHYERYQIGVGAVQAGHNGRGIVSVLPLLNWDTMKMSGVGEGGMNGMMANRGEGGQFQSPLSETLARPYMRTVVAGLAVEALRMNIVTNALRDNNTKAPCLLDIYNDGGNSSSADDKARIRTSYLDSSGTVVARSDGQFQGSHQMSDNGWVDPLTDSQGRKWWLIACDGFDFDNIGSLVGQVDMFATLFDFYEEGDALDEYHDAVAYLSVHGYLVDHFTTAGAQDVSGLTISVVPSKEEASAEHIYETYLNTTEETKLVEDSQNVFYAVGVAPAAGNPSYGALFDQLAAEGVRTSYKPWTDGSPIPASYANRQFLVNSFQRELILYNGRVTDPTSSYPYAHFTDKVDWGTGFGEVKYFQVEEADRQAVDPTFNTEGAELFAVNGHANATAVLSLIYTYHNLGQPGKRMNITNTSVVTFTSRMNSGPEFDAGKEEYKTALKKAYKAAENEAANKNIFSFGPLSVKAKHLPIIFLVTALAAAILVPPLGTLALWIFVGFAVLLLFSFVVSAKASYLKHGAIGMWPELLGVDHWGQGELDLLWADTHFMAGCFGLVPLVADWLGDPHVNVFGAKIGIEFLWSALMMYVYDLDGTACRWVMETEMNLYTDMEHRKHSGESGDGSIYNALTHFENYAIELNPENNPYGYYDPENPPF